jgi:hypothetical protein
MKVEGYEQPGVLLRPREDTLTTCGNCSIVCVGTSDKRKELWRILTRSGVVVEGEDAEPVAMSPTEAQALFAEREERRAAG